MNSRIRRLISLFLIISIFVGTGIVSVYANSESFEYTIVNGEVVISGYNGSETEISIPDTIKGYPVTAIAENAFNGCTDVAKFSIPASVKSIGANAFLKTKYYNDKDNWENNVLYIDDALIEVDYKLVGPCDIKDGTRIVADYAFMLSNSVSSISIPSTTEYIGEAAFINCDKLTEINVNQNNPYFTSVDGVLFNKDVTELIAYPNDASNTIYKAPDSVTSIGDKAFMYSLNVAQIGLPAGVETIGEYAFSYCKSLTNIKLPDNLKSLSDGIFDHCNSLKYIILPSKIDKINDNAFKWCSSLVSLSLPNDVKTIGANAFYNCRSLTEITIPDSVSVIKEAAFYNCKDLTVVNYTGNKDEWNAVDIKEHNNILDTVSINYNANINGSTGSNVDLPVETEPTTAPVTEPATTTPNEDELPDTKWMSVETYSKNTYSSSGDNYLVEDAVYSFYNAPVENTKCATATTSNGTTEALVMSLDSALPYDFNIGSIYYIKQTECPFGYIPDDAWYKLEVTEKGYILIDCATDKRVGYSNNDNRISLFVTPIVGDVALVSTRDGVAPDGYKEIGTYCVKESETDRTLYFNTYNQFNGYDTIYGAKNYTLYSDGHIALYNLPVGEYYFEKIVDEADETVLSERHYFEIKPNDTGIDCDLVKVEVKICNEPQNNVLAGDVNSDGKFNIKDATAIQKHLAHMIELDDTQLTNADYNCDGKVNVKDATTIQKVLAGLSV